MTAAIVALVVVGFLLLAAEMFLPGMIVGVVGFLCLCAAVALSYQEHGTVVGTYVLVGVSVVTLVGFVVWLAVFPRTPIGRKLTLSQEMEVGTSAEPPASLLGKRGVALTPLRPAGTVRIEGRKVDVVTEAFLESGQEVEVIAQEGMRVVVRAVEGAKA